MLRRNKIKKIIFSSIILICAGTQLEHDSPGWDALPGCVQSSFPKSTSESSMAVESILHKIAEFCIVVNFGLCNVIRNTNDPTLRRMLYENAKFARRILIINKDPKNAIAQTLDYINSVDLQIIPNMIKERESEICAKIYELSEIKGTLPFEIDLDFLALLGLMKSQVLSAEKDVQTLLKYLELSPGILKAFNQFYQMEMKIKDLHEWAATLKTLEQDPNPVCPDICIGPNTIRDHSVKGTTEDKRALFTDQGILQSYIRCNASQDHTYTFDELCRLHQLIAWLEHQKSIAEADAQDWFARWVDLGKQNPGKLCQFLFARAVKVKALCSLGCTDRLRNFKWASSSY